jgi:hypothetical protein
MLRRRCITLLTSPSNHGGKLIATSDTNKFHFSISAEDFIESKFSISDSALDNSGEVPLPGTVVHQIQLADLSRRSCKINE